MPRDTAETLDLISPTYHLVTNDLCTPSPEDRSTEQESGVVKRKPLGKTEAKEKTQRTAGLMSWAWDPGYLGR